MGTREMRVIASLIDQALTNRDDLTLARVRDEVRAMADAFPLYPAVVSRPRALQSA
jgi:glycine/serine hydroxymethyltransferase